MFALTVPQPYASMLAKRETMCVGSCRRVMPRQGVAIYAGKSRLLRPAENRAYVTGHIIAIADVEACEATDYFWSTYHFGRKDRTVGGVAVKAIADSEWNRHLGNVLVLSNVQAIEPIQVKGKAGLWLLRDEAAARVSALRGEWLASRIKEAGHVQAEA